MANFCSYSNCLVPMTALLSVLILSFIVFISIGTPKSSNRTFCLDFSFWIVTFGLGTDVDGSRSDRSNESDIRDPVLLILDALFLATFLRAAIDVSGALPLEYMRPVLTEA